MIILITGLASCEKDEAESVLAETLPKTSLESRSGGKISETSCSDLLQIVNARKTTSVGGNLVPTFESTELLESFQNELEQLMVSVEQASCLSEANIPTTQAFDMIYVDTDEFVYDQYRSVVIGDGIYFDGSLYELYRVDLTNLSGVNFLRSKPFDTLTLAELETHSIKVELSDADYFGVMNNCDPNDPSVSMMLSSGAVSECDENDLRGELRMLPGSAIIRVEGTIDWGDGSDVEFIDFIPSPGNASIRTESFEHEYPVDGSFFVNFIGTVYTDNGDDCTFDLDWTLRSSNSNCRIAEIKKEFTEFSDEGYHAIEMMLKKGRSIFRNRAKFHTYNWELFTPFDMNQSVASAVPHQASVEARWKRNDCSPGQTTSRSYPLVTGIGLRLVTKSFARGDKYYRSSDIFGDYYSFFTDGVIVAGRAYLDAGCQ